MSSKEEVPYSPPSIYRFGRERVARRFGTILSLMAKEISKPDTRPVQYLRDLSGVRRLFILCQTYILFFKSDSFLSLF